MRLSILGTIAYSDLFQYPLTLAELSSRLMGNFSTISETELKHTARQMNELDSRQDFWFLKGKDHLVQLRKKRQYFSQLKQDEVRTLQKVLEVVPTISSAYITGALAVENSHSISDDIDILIVTKTGSLWLTRLFVILMTGLRGKYRLHGSGGEFGWCFNLWLDQKHLQQPKSSRSVYTSYELLQSKQILGTKDELRMANEWIKEYINYSHDNDQKNNYEAQRKPERVWWLTLLRIFELLSYRFQLFYMASRRTTERVGEGFAFFHPRDTKGKILNKWKERLQQSGLSSNEVSQLVSYFEKGER